MRSSKAYRRVPLMAAVAALTTVGLVGTAIGAFQGSEKAKKPQVILGNDDDNVANPDIQPIPAPPDQSLSKGDQITGGLGGDTLIGRLGPDTIKAGPGDDVMVGGTEGGQPPPAVSNSDVAYGEAGSDTFIWSPGDGSDAFIGGDQVKVKNVKKSAKGKKKAKVPPDVDTLVIGNQILTADNATVQLFQTKFGRLPKVFSSDINVPTPLGGTPPRNPNLTGLCTVTPAPAGLGYNFLVRFFGSPGNLAVTIRTKGVEQVICPTDGANTATLTTLGSRGAGPLQTKSTNFKAAKGSKLAAFVF
jgi:hypothetical protein